MVVDLADFISRVSTARTGGHIIAGVVAEKPPELGGLLVPDGISATLIALPTIKTSHPIQELSAPTLCSRGVVRVQKVVMLQWRTPAFPLAWQPTAVAPQETTAESVTLRVKVFSKFLTKKEWGRVQLTPRDTIREMLAKLPGCGGDDIIDSFDFRKPDFAASSFYSRTARVKKGCVATLVSKSGHCGLLVKEFENKGSVHWLRQDDKESGELFLKRAYQPAADEGTPGLAFSASGSLGIRRPAGMGPSTHRVSVFRRGTLRSEFVSFLTACRMARHRGGLGFYAERLHDDFGQSSSSV